MNLRCISCNLIYPPGHDFCGRCGQVLSPIVPKPWWKEPKWLLLFGLLGFTVMVAIVKSDGPSRRSTETVKTSSASISPSMPSVDADAALKRFRTSLESLPKGVILSVEGTPVRGVARVQVSNLWFQMRPFERRQATQMMANVWAAEMQGESVILHIYDITGHEIAGTRAFGGVWIEDE